MADIHLMPNLAQDTTAPLHAINQTFLAFLTGPALHADQLIIMGDLFEAWLGDDVSMAFYSREIAALANLSRQGTQLYIGLGNRDFLIGQDLLKACQAKGVFADLIELYQNHHPAILLMHGDSLCTDDKAYQRLRFFTKQAWFKRFLRQLPLSWRLKLAHKLRAKSQAANQYKSAAIMDVSSASLAKLWLDYPKAQHLIHGHTHKPGHHHFESGKQRWVVGDWHEQGATYVAIEQGQPSLKQFNYP
ncbi:UDP-2,3-diacylglucosamine diphosphatase [Thiomicrospira aerophila]